MQEYPKYVYRPDPSDPKVIQSQRVGDEAAAKALGPGWSDNPTGAAEPAGAGQNAVPPAVAAGAAYVPKEYPKVLYRQDKDGKLHSSHAENAEAEAALVDKGWGEKPVGKPTKNAAIPADVAASTPAPAAEATKKAKGKAKGKAK